jgi:hypothetical protein
LKSFLWVLLGIVIGVVGFYFVTKIPESNVVKADSPRNLTLMFKQAVDDNSLYSVHELMTPEQKMLPLKSNTRSSAAELVQEGGK